jgi:hypothetical protein
LLPATLKAIIGDIFPRKTYLMTPVRNLSLVSLMLVLSTQCALAYVDPGVTGMLFQMGYVAFYGALAVLAAFFRPIKIFVLTVKQKLFGGKVAVPEKVTETVETDVEESPDLADVLDGKVDELEESEEKVAAE